MAEKLYRAIGFMTGTSMDGIDAAILETDGETVIRPGAAMSEPFGDALRRAMESAVSAARRWKFNGEDPKEFNASEKMLTEAHAQAVEHLLDEAGLTADQIDVIGFHGQTVLHRAPSIEAEGRTRQIGDGARLAALTGIDVVNDFRSADMAAGGHGAPLAPLYHAALAAQSGVKGAAGIVNLGGVGNITLLDGQGGLLAFDTGPANGPIDEWVARHEAGLFDKEGEIARRGTVDEERLKTLLGHAYFETPPPKSLDRFDFTADLAADLSLEDGAALLTEFAAAALASGLRWAPRRPEQLILTGGGRRNPVLVEAIRRRCDCTVKTAEDLGWRGDVLEAELFAWLAVRSLRGLPLSVPETTGVSEPVTGGVLHPARAKAA